MVRTLFLVLALANISFALKCFEGTLQGLENNTRTEEKVTFSNEFTALPFPSAVLNPTAVQY